MQINEQDMEASEDALTAHAGLLVQSVGRIVVLGGVNAIVQCCVQQTSTLLFCLGQVLIPYQDYCWSIVSHRGMKDISNESPAFKASFASVWQERLTPHE